MYIFTLIRLIILVTILTRSCVDSRNIAKLIDIPVDYNFFEIPFTPVVDDYTPPINVSFSTTIETIRNIDEANKELTLGMEIILGWTDWKIFAFRKNLTPSEVLDLIREGKHTNRVASEMITLNNPDYLKAIWKPNLYIYDLVETSQPNLISNLETLKYDGDGGYIKYITKVILKFSLPMDFEYYPLDSHTFTFKIRGFSYNEKLLNLEWDKPPTFAGYDNPNFDVQLESFSQSKTIVHGKLKEIFNFKVNESKFKQGTPKSAKVKALDIWMVSSIFFVFLMLVKFAMLLWFKNRQTEYEKVDLPLRKISSSVSLNVHNANHNLQHRCDDRSMIHDIENSHGFYVIAKNDAKSRLAIILRCIWILETVAFPLFLTMFLIFIISFWSWLVVRSNFMTWPAHNRTLNPNL
ncbi:Glycine receptor subunit alpha-4 [Folsomia candida]|uniref:Glycine receptor subunit alpha-4 n=1 Tax=Folsomia candida TaxID=158441 RepID=A0A226D517_FOLCA|nr:Glycine receptor subunit alpha-4 [Folsomia candida]